ncbi:MAPEG family protein [Sphingomonas swuensis]|uniref:MAPEG family protein n=1 Tax=Sphingomonas swuensis TaxID=977800 RepID=A0ABP7STF6_9SPHN
MPPSPLLGPVVALVAWSLVMLVWTAVARRGAFKRMGVSLRTIPAGSRGNALDNGPEAKAQWKAHNYNHLMEQPTIFYAIVLALAVMGFDHHINVLLAWGYVGLRIIHSIVQATINIVAIRLSLFALSTLCLAALTIHAAMYLWH